MGTIFIERIADIIVIFFLALAAGFWSFRNTERAEIVNLLFLIGFIAAAVLVVFLVVLRGCGAQLGRRDFPLASPTSGNASTRAAPAP